MSDKGFIYWVQNLLAILWVNQSTMHTLTSKTPNYINCANETVLPIELEIPT